MKKMHKAFAVGVAAVLACGVLAGCDDLTITDSVKDYAQVIAKVNITDSAEFKNQFAGYEGFIETAEIGKQEMAASFVSNYSYLAQYGYDVSDIFDMIAESLATRQVRVQYSIAYLAQRYHDAEKDETQFMDGDLTAYQSLMGGTFENDAAKNRARLAFFLTDEEQDKADYDVRVSINDALDSTEQTFIRETADDDGDSEELRTLPTGADTENEDYYATEAHYKVYTGLAEQLADNEYEPQDGSTSSTRKKAYNRLVASLRANAMLGSEENTAELEKTSYFLTQCVSQYETAILDKVNDLLEEEGAAKLTEEFTQKAFDEKLVKQTRKYKSTTDFETDFNAVSDSSFTLTTHSAEKDGTTKYDAYGYVINILLPFDVRQTQKLSDATADYGDKNGNKFVTRASLLKNLKATDQRGSWFTGEKDYSFSATDGFTGGVETRGYLFFEDNLSDAVEKIVKYEKIKNYYGKYTYNGTVEKQDDKYTVKPTPIDIDGFLKEMDGYVKSAQYGEGSQLSIEFFDGYQPGTSNAAYYTNTDFTYEETVTDPETGSKHKKGDVDYSAFEYASGKITAADNAPFDANEMFVEGTWENTAFSVIRELSFAYNTDTAGLNTYLGYMISPYTTSFVKEFEYAAQTVVRRGAGNFMVVPSDYGWHIIYCTFSFADMAEGESTPFTFDYTERKGGENEREDSFSYLFFEMLKGNAVSEYLSTMQTAVHNEYYDDGVTIFEETFEDFKNLG